MTTSEKVAYLKGLAEGMGINEDAGEGKLFKVIIDILEDLSLDLADTRDTMTDLPDALEAVSDDLAELEEEVYEGFLDDDDDEDEDDEDDDDEDDDEPLFYSVECPGCGFRLTVDEDILEGGSFECPECGEVIDLTKADVEEVEFEDDEEEDDSDEIPF